MSFVVVLGLYFERSITEVTGATPAREVVMRAAILYMSMSLDGFVGSDREHPGVAVSDAELKQWKLDRISNADLIDEYRLLVQPLVLGRGQALFDQLPESRHLDLVQATPFPSGIVVHVYRPQHT
jgi:RibD C-terminal domain